MPNGQWKLKADKAFLALSIVFGLLFLFITPPMKVHDEWYHFVRALKITDGQILAVKNEQGLPGGFIPTEVWVTVTSLMLDVPYDPAVGLHIEASRVKTLNDPFVKERKNDRRRTILSLLNVMPPTPGNESRVFVTYPNTAYYFPLGHLPQAFGIATGRLMGFPPVVWVYLGRLFNLCSWVLLTYMAVRITPVQKWGFVLLGLTPMTLFLASSLSVDAVTIALAFLIIAVLLRHASDRLRQFSSGDKVLIVFLSVAVSLSKFYFLLPLLLLLVRHKFSSKLGFALFLAIVFSSVVISVAGWTYMVGDLYSSASPDAFLIDQAHYLANNPYDFLLTFLWEPALNSWAYIRQFVGHLGHYGVLYVPTSLVLLHAGVIAFASLTEIDNDNRITLRQKAVVTIVLFGSILVIMAAIYVASRYVIGTHATAPWATALQGRYLIPIAPLALALLYNRKIGLGRRDSWLKLLVPAHLTLILSVTLYVILNAYYP